MATDTDDLGQRAELLLPEEYPTFREALDEAMRRLRWLPEEDPE